MRGAVSGAGYASSTAVSSRLRMIDGPTSCNAGAVSSPSITALLAMGFDLISQWRRSEKGIQVAHLDWVDCAGWLYAFVSDGTVKYVGLTGGVLRTRLDQYRDGADAYGHETQCGRIKARILHELQGGHSVLIYGLRKRGCDTATLRPAEREALNAVRGPGLWNRA